MELYRPRLYRSKFYSYPYWVRMDFSRRCRISPDGQKLFVWERGGKLYVCNRDGSGNYIKQTTPVADISEVANWDAHGMLGFALDPNFQSNGLIYLLYAVDRHHLLFSERAPTILVQLLPDRLPLGVLHVIKLQ